MRKQVWTWCVGFAFVWGCQSGSQTGGRFSLQLLEAPAPSNLRLDKITPRAASESQTFHLGELRATRDFFFLLSNSGDATITDIEITTDKPAVIASPAKIAILEPQVGVSLLPLLRLTAQHGRDASGVGVADVLPMGSFVGQVTIKGTTTSGSTMVQAQLAADVKTMAINLLDDESVVDLTNVTIGLDTRHGGLGFTRAYCVDGTPKMKNTGNVPIKYTYYEGNLARTVLGTGMIAPQETATILYGNSAATEVAIDGDAIVDNNQLLLGSDGVAYFGVWKGSSCK